MAAEYKHYRDYSTRVVGNSKGIFNTEYVCIGTPEETLLETYFMMLSKFNFDRARDQCEKEREAKSSISGANWCEFMNLLCRLAMAETSYHNLTFVGKSFLKKEPLRVTYQVLIQELKKVQEVYAHGRGGTEFNWEKKLADLIQSIIEYLSARMEMIAVYQSIDTPPEGSLYDCLFINKQCKGIQEKFTERFKHQYLKPVQQNFWNEVEILSQLVTTQHHLSLWQFLPSMLCIQTSHNKLSSWCGVLPPGIPGPEATPRLSNIRARSQASHSPSVPVMYRWLCTYHNSLLSKLTLYFYNQLFESGAIASVKGISAKLDQDYIQRFYHIVKTTPSACVCLVFDSSTIENFQGPKYQIPGTPPISLTGLNSYPIMVSIPMEFDFLSHKANIVSMIMSRGMSSPSTGISTHHDSKLTTTYHLAQIDRHVTLVVIQHTVAGRDKDSPVILPMTELIYYLRCHHVLHYLTKK